MGAVLDWKPQEAFSEFFHTTAEEIIEKRTVFKEDLTYFVPYGGRGSAKSFTFIDACVVEAALRPIRVLCTREIQLSIDESIKAEIEAAIVDRELSHFFKITDKQIVGLNGSKFMFKGIKNNIKNIKSISDVDIVLCEESENVSKNSWDKLLPSIRPRSPFGGRKQRPIIIVIFNPDDELDDTYQRFIINPPPRSCVKLINWRDNKYFPENLEEMRLHSLKTRPLSDHEHDWEGKPKSASDDVIIQRDWVRAARFASRKEGFTHQGDKVVAYDPAGQGKDNNAVMYADGNIIKLIDEWLKSADLREATNTAYDRVTEFDADKFVYDTCGGLGDGVSVFVSDKRKEALKAATELKDGAAIEREKNRVVFPFDAGGAVVYPDVKIPGTDKTWGERCSNAKAQAHMVSAQKLYNTYRFIVLDEKDIDPGDMISIDIEDDQVFNKLVKELSCPLWVKSATNSKRKVEDKKVMEKRTGQKSPNIADDFHMINAPMEQKAKSWYDIRNGN
jgi:phage terminase large subunit